MLTPSKRRHSAGICRLVAVDLPDEADPTLVADDFVGGSLEGLGNGPRLGDGPEEPLGRLERPAQHVRCRHYRCQDGHGQFGPPRGRPFVAAVRRPDTGAAASPVQGQVVRVHGRLHPPVDLPEDLRKQDEEAAVRPVHDEEEVVQAGLGGVPDFFGRAAGLVPLGGGPLRQGLEALSHVADQRRQRPLVRRLRRRG